jgi:hypothetical protein
MARLIMLAFVLSAALVSAGCWYEVRNGEVWACGSVTGEAGTITGCQPTGVQIVP